LTTLQADNRLLQKRLDEAKQLFENTKGLASDQIESLSTWKTRCSEIEQTVLQLKEEYSHLLIEKQDCVEDKNELQYQVNLLTNKLTMERDDHRRMSVSLQESDNKLAEIKVLVAYMENTARQQAERSTRLLTTITQG
jgi:ABC-type phosphate transport system auxiliary subunit